jgi:hypothetical protein
MDSNQNSQLLPLGVAVPSLENSASLCFIAKKELMCYYWGIPYQ